MLFSPRPGQLKCEAQDAINATARKYRFLDDGFLLGTLIEPPADLRILALVVFPDDVKINVVGFAAGQR